MLVSTLGFTCSRTTRVAYLTSTCGNTRRDVVVALSAPLQRQLSSSPSISDHQQQHANKFSELMDFREGSVLTEDLDSYNQDWSNRWKGNSSLVLRPNSTKQVSSILEYCNHHNLKVVPQGGNTGLVGGGVPRDDEVILSLKSMNQIHSLDDSSGILVCDAGCILQQVQAYAANQGFLVPIDIGSKGTCLIGGNLSTNAGGQYRNRFGSFHANLLGLEVVLASGEVLDLMNTNLKDNTGYDMKHLFIGAEGTLGVVTKMVVHCPPFPISRQAIFVACEDYKTQVMDTLKLAKSLLGETLSAVELLDGPVMDLVDANHPVPLKSEAGTNYPYALLIETQGSSEAHDGEKMEMFLSAAVEQGAVVDGIVAHDMKQLLGLWEIRESCGVAVASAGRPYKYDVSLPLATFETVMNDLRKRLAESHPNNAAIAVNWAHILDQDLHLNVVTPGKFEFDQTVMDRLEPYLIDVVVSHGGSISAEHGLGQDKNMYMNQIKDPVVLETMKSLKDLFDPKGILNPGKVFPSGS